MEQMLKKYQQKFRKVKDEMDRWDGLQSSLISQFANASVIIQRLQAIQESKNYGALNCVKGIEDALLAKQMDSLQNILISMNKTMEDFHGIVLFFEKIVRDFRQLMKGGSAQATKKMHQRIGIKPAITDFLDGVAFLHEMHHSDRGRVFEPACCSSCASELPVGWIGPLALWWGCGDGLSACRPVALVN